MRTGLVGGFPTVTAVLLPRAVSKLRNDHPGIAVQIVESSTPAQLLAPRRGRLEVAVLATGRGLPERDLEGLQLCELRTGRGAGVAVADNHPFALRDWVEPEEFVSQVWMVGARSGEAPELGAWHAIQEPKMSFAVRDWLTRLGRIAAGLGIALVPGLRRGGSAARRPVGPSTRPEWRAPASDVGGHDAGPERCRDG